MACVTDLADGNWCKLHCRSRIEGIILDSDIASVCRMSVSRKAAADSQVPLVAPTHL